MLGIKKKYFFIFSLLLSCNSKLVNVEKNIVRLKFISSDETISNFSYILVCELTDYHYERIKYGDSFPLIGNQISLNKEKLFTDDKIKQVVVYSKIGMKDSLIKVLEIFPHINDTIIDCSTSKVLNFKPKNLDFSKIRAIEIIQKPRKSFTDQSYSQVFMYDSEQLKRRNNELGFLCPPFTESLLLKVRYWNNDSTLLKLTNIKSDSTIYF